MTAPLLVAPVVLEVHPPDAIVTPEIPVNAPTRMLFCDNCGEWTVHTLNRAGEWKYYMCDCGTGIMYLIVARPGELK